MDRPAALAPGAGPRRFRGWRRWQVFSLALLLLLGGGYPLWVARWRPLPVEGTAPSDGLIRVPGVVHVHSSLSDGGGSPAEVAAAARAAGLGFVILTDHNNLDAKAFEGYHDGVLVLVGSELSTTAGHLVGLGLTNDPAFRFSGDAEDGLDDIRLLGGTPFAAHPLSLRGDFQFTGWDLPGPWGLELLNGDSQWRSAGWGRLLRTAALYRLNRSYALVGSLTAPSLEAWDALLAEREVPGIVGADAHSRVPIRKDVSIRFPSYQALFRLVRNHVLLKSPLSGRVEVDAPAVLEALARGRAYVGVDALAPAGGFFFVAEAGGHRWSMGDTVVPSPDLTLKAGGLLPAGTRLTLRRNGRMVKEAVGGMESRAEQAGVYRVEARVPGSDLPWIISNPIYVFDRNQAAARQLRGAWPAPRAAPAAVKVIADFEAAPPFTPEFDPSSEVSPAVTDPKAGVDGRAAARLQFRLGAPGPAQPHTWCALVNRESRDLSAYRGLVLALKGDGVYRIWVQVRDQNPASEDQGLEHWFASLRTSNEWTRVAVPFSKFRSTNKKSDGRLDLEKIRSLVFVLDVGAVKPGTRGTIWIDDLGVY
ncbi:MAG TPA: CIA30 family protein [Vicinamibacteria bacterium]|nr:CIA30 family protein [Vicinamibacteria bacterium]